jgi:hypothetical protein
MADEPKDRLVQARKAAGHRTREDAIRALRWNRNSYKSHEDGTRGITRKRAQDYAKAYRVSHLWLLCESDVGGPPLAPVNQDTSRIDGDGSEVDAYRMALALTKAQEIVSSENLPSEDRQMRIVRLQLGIYRFLTWESERGAEVNQELADRIAALIRETEG